MKNTSHVLACASALLVTACAASDDPDLGEITQAATTPPPLTYHGGRVIDHVQVSAVFWGTGIDDTVRGEIPAFYATVTGSPYMDWLSEYATPQQTIGRGTLRAIANITPSNHSASLTDSDIRTELLSQLQAGALLPPNDDSLYMVHFPRGVAITDRSGKQSCVHGGFCGYHGKLPYNGKWVPYAVLPDMSPGSGCETICGKSSQFNNQTAVASHELVEAVTDPDLGTGWLSGPNADGKLEEIGDLCTQKQAPLVGTGYVVQKEWANSAAACVAIGRQSGVTYTRGDFNGDGRADLIVTTVSGSAFWFANPDGTFRVVAGRADLPLGGVSYVPGDFNGDRKTDLVITTTQGSFWYFSNGDGTFSVPYQRPDLPIGAVTYTPGDFNGDGLTDLVITTTGGSYWYYSNGDGNFTATDPAALPLSSVAYTPGDFDGDGTTDLMVTTAQGSFLYLYKGTGLTNPYSRPDLPLGAVVYTPGDFDGDRRTDLIVTTANGSFMYLSNGNGTWRIPTTALAALKLGLVSYTAGDFNRDGRTDLVTTGPTRSSWYFSNGDGTFVSAYTRTDLPLDSAMYTPGDFDGDGRTDLVITTSQGSFWYRSNGDGTWTFPVTRTDLPL